MKANLGSWWNILDIWTVT